MASPTDFICVVGLDQPREIFEGKTGDLDNTIVNRWFKRGWRDPGNIVRDLIQRVAYGKFGSDLGNGETRGFRSQGRAPRHTRIHLNDNHLTVLWIDCKLNI